MGEFPFRERKTIESILGLLFVSFYIKLFYMYACVNTCGVRGQLLEGVFSFYHVGFGD